MLVKAQGYCGSSDQIPYSAKQGISVCRTGNCSGPIREHSASEQGIVCPCLKFGSEPLALRPSNLAGSDHESPESRGTRSTRDRCHSGKTVYPQG